VSGVHDSEQHLQLFKALFHPIAGDKLRTSRRMLKAGPGPLMMLIATKTWIFLDLWKICAEIQPKKTYPKGRCLLHIWKIQEYETMDDKHIKL